MKSSTPIFTITIFESSLSTKMSFLRKYFAAILGEFFLLSTVCSLIMLSPVARFYVTENDWMLYLFCFLYTASYASLLYCSKLPVISRVLIIHITVQAFAVSIFVTYNDWMYLYKAIIISTCAICTLFLYTLQSKWNFNIWIVMLINSVCIYFSFIILKALFGGSFVENVASILVSIIILFYQSFAVFRIMYCLTPVDYVHALINIHMLFANEFMFSKSQE